MSWFLFLFSVSPCGGNGLEDSVSVGHTLVSWMQR